MTSTSPLFSRLATYGAAAASAAAASQAAGSVVFFDIPDTTTPNSGARLIYFTPSNGLFATSPQANSSAYQFVIVGGTTIAPLTGIRPNAAFGISPNSAVTLRSGPDLSPARLTLGAVIGGAGQFDGPAGTLASGGFYNSGNFIQYGNWNVPGVATSGYVGFRFGTAGNFQYGWANIAVNSDYSITLRSFAFETVPNTPITAGAIPEPGTSALLLLGLGAGGLATYRARRRQS
ncbi:MAG: PEP-CTERM sorting domain-containing protein [Verrucomicrobia bacterium]|nr:PEP-CTERM sorting domain-containing protein [Verrucomicrobiota bacterium]